MSKNRKSGHAVIEAALLVPWIFFLFVGVLDFGFYAYAAIATQNAARVAAMQTSDNTATAANSSLACSFVLEELGQLPNVDRNTTPCLSSPDSLSLANPLAVRAEAVAGPDGANATRVTVAYRTIPLIPIPGVMMMQFTITRIVEMRLRS